MTIIRFPTVARFVEGMATPLPWWKLLFRRWSMRRKASRAKIKFDKIRRGAR